MMVSLLGTSVLAQEAQEDNSGIITRERAVEEGQELAGDEDEADVPAAAEGEPLLEDAVPEMTRASIAPVDLPLDSLGTEWPVETDQELADALRDAADGDVILLNADSFTLDDTVEIDTSITIKKGPDVEWSWVTVVDARHFVVTNDAVVIIENFTLSGSYSSPSGGGGIDVLQGSLILNNTTIVNCAAAKGGAVYVAAGGELQAMSSSFSLNSAEEGGAVYMEDYSSLYMENTSFGYNSAPDRYLLRSGAQILQDIDYAARFVNVTTSPQMDYVLNNADVNLTDASEAVEGVLIHYVVKESGRSLFVVADELHTIRSIGDFDDWGKPDIPWGEVEAWVVWENGVMSDYYRPGDTIMPYENMVLNYTTVEKEYFDDRDKDNGNGGGDGNGPGDKDNGNGGDDGKGSGGDGDNGNGGGQGGGDGSGGGPGSGDSSGSGDGPGSGSIGDGQNPNTDPLSVTGVPTSIWVGDTFTLVPEESETREGGDGWTWDDAYFSATFNSPATFTALKAGTTTVIFESGTGRRLELELTILEKSSTGGSGSGSGDSAIVKTGDDNGLALPFVLLGGLAVLSGGAFVFLRKVRGLH